MKKIFYIIPIIALIISLLYSLIYFKNQKANNLNFPDAVILPKPDEIAIEPETSLEYVKGEIIIGFIKHTDVSTVVKIVQNVGGTIVGSDKRINQYQIRIDNKNISEIRKIIEMLKQNPNVEYAIPSWASLANG